jgi:hypothetical protein
LGEFGGEGEVPQLDVEECLERDQLIEEYGRSVSDFNFRLDSLRIMTGGRDEQAWKAAKAAQEESQRAWEQLEKHLAEHECLVLYNPAAEASASDEILGRAAVAALDVILVVDDQRRFVNVNEAAAALLKVPRRQIVGRRIEEFFSEARGEAIPEAWSDFVAKGVQCGIVELISSGRRRKFEYRAKANFAPGLHLSILRGIADASQS